MSTPPNLKTLEEAIDYVAATVTPEQQAGIIPGAARDYCFFGGMAVRNGLGLWHDNALTRHFKSRFGLGHADDMSGLIMDGAWAKLGGEAFDLEAEVARYKTHWAKYGVDPLTQKPVEKPAPVAEAKPVAEKNGGGIDWTVLNLADARIQRRTPEPRKTFWDKLGDAIFGQR